MALTTYAAQTNEQRVAYELTLIKRKVPYLAALEDGQNSIQRKGTGLTAEWRTFAALPLATTALTEGTPPVENDLTVTKVTATLAQYGAWSKHSDVLQVAGVDNVVVEVVGMHGEQAGQSLHSLLMTQLAAGSNVRYASTATSRVTVAAGMNISVAELRKVKRDLARNNVMPYPDGYYRGIVHPDAEFDLMNDTQWQDANKYVDTQNILKGEIGRIAGFRFRRSTQAPKFAGAGAAGIDVYASLFYGPGAWGKRDLETMTTGVVNNDSNRGIAVHVVPRDTPSKADPLNQYGTVGWKLATTFKVLDSAKIVRLEHSATA